MVGKKALVVIKGISSTSAVMTAPIRRPTLPEADLRLPPQMRLKMRLKGIDTIRRSIILLLCQLVAACYDGDGHLESEGVILKSYRLTLPLNDFGKGGKHEFNIEGFSIALDSIHMAIELSSRKPMEYWKMNTIVDLEIYDKNLGQVIYRKRSVLPEYYQRVKGMDHYQFLSGEWLGHYKYDSFNSDQRPYYVPKDMEPEPQNGIRFFNTQGDKEPIDYGIKWKRDYRITILVEEPDPRFLEVEGALVFSAGWK